MTMTWGEANSFYFYRNKALPDLNQMQRLWKTPRQAETLLQKYL